MKDQIEAIQTEAFACIAAAADPRALDEVRVAVLGRNGSLTEISAGMRDLPKEDKAAVGALLNTARNAITAALEEKQLTLENIAAQSSSVNHLGTIALFLLTVLLLLFILSWFGMDSSHDNTIGGLERVGILLVPGILIVLIIKRLAGGQPAREKLPFPLKTRHLLRVNLPVSLLSLFVPPLKARRVDTVPDHQSRLGLFARVVSAGRCSDSSPPPVRAGSIFLSLCSAVLARSLCSGAKNAAGPRKRPATITPSMRRWRESLPRPDTTFPAAFEFRSTRDPAMRPVPRR
jgi:hypothetical protein